LRRLKITTAKDTTVLEIPTISAADVGLLTSFRGTKSSEPGSIEG
jgi:hypothetical protein